MFHSIIFLTFLSLLFLTQHEVACFFTAPRTFHAPVPLAMAMERLEFTIHSDGRVEEKVTGVKGSDCMKITEVSDSSSRASGEDASIPSS